MGGEVAFAIRRGGVQETRELAKYAASHIATADFFSMRGSVHRTWNKAPKVPFAPLGYGLVAVDFDRKWVGAIQNYTNMRTQYFHLFAPGEIENVKEELSKLHSAGRLVKIKDVCGISPLPGSNFTEWFDTLVRRMRTHDANSFSVEVDPPKGWTVQSYTDDVIGWSEFVKDLSRSGWTFPASDIQSWKDYEHNGNPSAIAIEALVADAIHEDLDIATTTASSSRTRQRL